MKGFGVLGSGPKNMGLQLLKMKKLVGFHGIYILYIYLIYLYQSRQPKQCAYFSGKSHQITHQNDHRLALFDSPNVGQFNDPCSIRSLSVYKNKHIRQAPGSWRLIP